MSHCIKIQTEEYTQGRESPWLFRNLDVTVKFFLFLEKLASCSGSSSAWNCTIWGCCLAEEVSSGDRFLCFNFIVGWNVPQCSCVQCRLCPFTGETFLRRGAIGPAERNINTTKKITEHVTESYHIDSLIEISARKDASGAMLFLSTRGMLHHHKDIGLAHCSLRWRSSQATALLECVSTPRSSLWEKTLHKKSFRFIQKATYWNRTRRKKQKNAGH